LSECFRCGVCCIKFQAPLSAGEVRRISAFLGIEADEFIRRFTDPRWHGKEKLLLHTNGACSFLNFDPSGKINDCHIHQVRPAACRDWVPGPDKLECREGLSKHWRLSFGDSGLNKPIIVVGAGAGGMMAAGKAAETYQNVILLEKNTDPGKKILISGKTRCNLTNQRELQEFIPMYGDNGRFLYSAFNKFFREDLLELLGKYGVETKTERGGRIFPISDDARDVVAAFKHYLNDRKVEIMTNTRVIGVKVEEGRVTAVRSAQGELPASAVILATGGASFPGTGSTGDGYRVAEEVGHAIKKLRPALVPLVVEEKEIAGSMQGVSLRNVRLTSFRCTADKIQPEMLPVYDCGRGVDGKRPKSPVIESRMGEMMMTHFGIGGPITLRMSLAIVDALEEGPVSVAIDLKPGMDTDQLRRRLQRDFDTFGQRQFRHILKELLPNKMIEPFLRLSGISGNKTGHEVSGLERERLLGLLKVFRFNIKSSLPLAAAMVTAGGVSLDEIDPRTMASKLVTGLYFCGEVMDIDADTGGYNLQAAFSTGYLAGEQAALFAGGKN